MNWTLQALNKLEMKKKTVSRSVKTEGGDGTNKICFKKKRTYVLAFPGEQQQI